MPSSGAVVWIGIATGTITLILGILASRSRSLTDTVNFLKLKLTQLEEGNKESLMRIKLLEEENSGLRKEVVRLLSKILLGEGKS